MEEEPQRVEGRCAWGQGEVPGSLSKRSPVEEHWYQPCPLRDSYVGDKSTVARNSCGQKEKVDEKERLSTFIHISL